MNTTQTAELSLAGPIDVQLLTEEELFSIKGGKVYLAVAALAGGGAAALVVGVIVGLAIYYYTQ